MSTFGEHPNTEVRPLILSKREALEMCVVMWEWLANNPSHSKAKAAEVLNLPKELEETANCAACYYAKQVHTKDLFVCTNCPVWTNAVSSDIRGCYEINSPYRKWYTSFNQPSRAKNAKEIADLARAQLAKLEKE